MRFLLKSRNVITLKKLDITNMVSHYNAHVNYLCYNLGI